MKPYKKPNLYSNFLESLPLGCNIDRNNNTLMNPKDLEIEIHIQ